MSDIAWRELVAGHEAGHAVIAWHCKALISEVTSVPFTMTDGTKAGGVVKVGGFRSPRAEAACDLGGYIANIVLQEIPADTAWEAAEHDIQNLIDAGIPVGAWLVHMDSARAILCKRRRQWERLYTRLLTTDEVSWREAATVLGRRDPYRAGYRVQ